MKLGITGGIGCGKSSALEAFRSYGASVIASDAIVHALLEKDTQLQTELADHFGTRILNRKGAIDRSVLAEIVFNDSNALKWLEDKLHPLVRASWKSFAEAQDDNFACIEIPLLFEKKLEKHFDFVVCISCSDAVANARLLEKGFSEESIRHRRTQQLPIALKISKSDFIIENNGSLEYLNKQCQLLHSRLSS